MKLHVKILFCFIFVYGMIYGQEVPYVEYYGELVNASNACVKAPIILKSPVLTETISTSQFQFTEPDEAYYQLTENQKKAAKYVLSIFSKLIVSSVPIKVFIKCEDFGEITGTEPKPLAKSKATSYYNTNNTTPFLQNTQYPIALAEAIKGENLNTDNNEIEIILKKRKHPMEY